MKLSLYAGETRDLERCLAAIVDAERRGLHAAWLPGGLALDTLTVLAVAAGRTERIRLGAGIAYAWPRHPIVLAQQALTVAAASGGRFELGIGTGHRGMLEQTFGLTWDAPTSRMLEYGGILRDLLEHGRASLDGRHYRVEAALWLTERPPVPIVVGALGERMCAAAGQFADAIMTWLAPACYLDSVVLPAARRGAEQAGRPQPRIVAAIPAALTSDRPAALAGLNATFGMMSRARSYVAMLERAGLARPADAGGWTEQMLDTVVAWGDERALETRVRQLADAGADEVVLWPFPAGADPAASLTATVDTMQRLAARRPAGPARPRETTTEGAHR
ncbi:MAG TPA: LLM class flavin-dependent oxidoreductase [Solirubrobacteraceae bacterium]|nr:LLM class flavin-dependent oxidoreductase [Solirubrobacteraceae bacterium]